MKTRRTKSTNRRLPNYPQKTMTPIVHPNIPSSISQQQNEEICEKDVRTEMLEMNPVIGTTTPPELDMEAAISNIETHDRQSDELELDMTVTSKEWDETLELYQNIIESDQPTILDSDLELNLSALEWDLTHLTTLGFDQTQRTPSTEVATTGDELDMIDVADSNHTPELHQSVIQFETSTPNNFQYSFDTVSASCEQSIPDQHPSSSHQIGKQRKPSRRSREKKAKDDLIVVNGTPYWEVEYVFDKRKRDNTVEYLVKWVGYKKEESTWEPISSFQTMDCVKQFEFEQWIDQLNQFKNHTEKTECNL